MSVRKHVHFNEHGDPVLVIRAVGHSDVYRLACHLELGQSEFAALGRNIIGSLRRRWGARKLAALEHFYWGPDGRHGRGDRDRARLAGSRPAAVARRLRRRPLTIHAAGGVL